MTYDAIELGLGPDPRYGDVSELSLGVTIGLYTLYQLKWVALGRGCLREYGDVAHFTPLPNAEMLVVVSLSLGHDHRFGVVSDLDFSKLNSAQLRIIALGRGSDPQFGSVDDIDFSDRRHRPLEVISTQRGCRWTKP